MPLLNDIIETLPQHHYFRDDIIFIIDTDLRTILSYKRGNMFVDNGSGLVSFLPVSFVVKLFTTLNGEINKFFSTAIAEGVVLPSISVEDETLIPTPEIRNSIMDELLLLKERVTLLENG